jgi:hypothetical protein
MKIKLYANKEQAAIIREATKAADGHCPCVLEALRNEDTKCMCKEFREAPVGTVCHCGLYEKVDE